MALPIGFALCGSFCCFEKVFREMRELVSAGHTLLPILSFHAGNTDTRFGLAEDFKNELTAITGHYPMLTMQEVERIGPQALVDVLAVAPCTGTTLGKLANGISDTPVTMAVKSHLRREQPVVLAISTNDALGGSFRSFAQLKNTKHLFFVPMAQDDTVHKPNSLVADFSRIGETIEAAMEGRQLQPLFVAKPGEDI